MEKKEIIEKHYSDALLSLLVQNKSVQEINECLKIDVITKIFGMSSCFGLSGLGGLLSAHLISWIFNYPLSPKLLPLVSFGILALTYILYKYLAPREISPFESKEEIINSLSEKYRGYYYNHCKELELKEDYGKGLIYFAEKHFSSKTPELLERLALEAPKCLLKCVEKDNAVHKELQALCVVNRKV